MITQRPPLSALELEELEKLIKKADPATLAQMDLEEIYAYLTGRQFSQLWNPLPGPQTMAYETEADELFFGGSAGGGKALCVKTLIPIDHPELPNCIGWTTMGELTVGSTVLTERGNTCSVIGVSDITPQAGWTLTFENGDQISASNDHRWPIHWGDGSSSIHTTTDIVNNLSKSPGVLCPFDFSPSWTPENNKRRIIKAVPIDGFIPMRCIVVDNPTSLFLAGRTMIPTHNSELILGLALNKHKKSLILRRVAQYLKGMAARFKEIVGQKGSWKSSGYGGIMKVGNRSVELGGCEHEKDKENFQGTPHDLIAFDEASHFTKSQYQFIVAWNRSVDPQQKCRVVCAGNPPTSPEGRWVVEEWAPWLDSEFPDPAQPGELRWYTTINGKTAWYRTNDPIQNGDEIVVPRSRTFIPSRLSDNPILASTGYGNRLQALPEPLRSQLLYGDMTAGTEDNPFQVIPTEWVRLAQKRWTDSPPDSGTPCSGLGVDVARGGAAKTVISKRYGSWYAKLIKIPGSVTPDGGTCAAQIFAVYEGDCPVKIDVTGGFGGSPYDILKERYGNRIVGVNNSVPSKLKDRSGLLTFLNVRAASYWKFREALDPIHGENLALPPDAELVADLTSPRYELMASGIKVEKKDDIIKRLGRSPDCADAVVLAHWEVKKKQFWIR